MSSDSPRALLHWAGHTFAVRGLSPEAIVTALDGTAAKPLPADAALSGYLDRCVDLNWSFGKDKGPLPMLVSAPLEGWVFCYHSFVELRTGVTQLLKAGAAEAHGFYGDSHVDGYSWVIGRAGKIVRLIDYYWTVQEEEGEAICAEEAEWVRLKRSNDDDDDERAAFGEDMVTTVFQAACGIQATEHPFDAVFLLADVPRKEEPPAPPEGLVYEATYRSGPLAVADWVAGGNFDGYVYGYELQLHANGSYDLRTRILDRTRADEPVDDKAESGYWSHTDKGTFTLQVGIAEWRGVVTGNRGQYLVFSATSKYGSRTICLQRAEAK